MLYSLQDRTPIDADKANFIAPNASVIGSVQFNEGVSIWFNVVIRADCELVILRKNCNIQDGSVLHVDPGFPLDIGENVTVGHNAMVHGCTVGDNSLIGINAVVLNGAKIGKNCLVGANALVPEGMEVPDNSMVLGSPAKVVKSLSEAHIEGLKWGAEHYVENGKLFAEHLKEL